VFGVGTGGGGPATGLAKGSKDFGLLLFGKDGDDFQEARRAPAKHPVPAGIRLQGPARQRMNHLYFTGKRPGGDTFDIFLNDFKLGVGDVVDVTLRAAR